MERKLTNGGGVASAPIKFLPSKSRFEVVFPTDEDLLRAVSPYRQLDLSNGPTRFYSLTSDEPESPII